MPVAARDGEVVVVGPRSSPVLQPALRVRAFVRDDRSGPDIVVRLVTPEGAATMRIGRDRLDPVDEDTAADVTLRGEVDVLAAALDPQQVPALLSDGQLQIDGDPRAVRRLAKVFAPPRVRRSGHTPT